MLNFEESFLRGELFAWVDPRALILTCMAMLIGITNIHNLCILLIICAVCFLLVAKKFKTVLKRLLPVNIFAVFLWLTVPFTAENGVRLVLLYILRMNGAALIFMVFIAPLGIGKLSNALTEMKVPPKLVSVLILTHRYIFILWEKISTSSGAMQLRKPENIGIVRLWRTYAAMIATSITGAAFRAERVQQAMLCRGFTGVFPATIIFRWGIKDTFFVTAGILLSFILWYIGICLK